MAIHPRTRPSWAPVARRAAPASGPCRPPVSSLLEHGLEQAAERRHVGPDPAGPVDDQGAGAAGGGAQPGGLDHEGLGPGRRLGEVGLELGHGGGVECPGPGRAQTASLACPTQVATRSATSHDTGLVTAPSVGSASPPPPSQAIFLPRSRGVLGAEVQAAVLVVVVDRQLGVAARLGADPARREGARRPPVAGERRGPDRLIAATRCGLPCPSNLPPVIVFGFLSTPGTGVVRAGARSLCDRCEWPPSAAGGARIARPARSPGCRRRADAGRWSARVARRLAAFLFDDGVVDPLAQGLGDVVLAAVGDHLRGARTRSRRPRGTARTRRDVRWISVRRSSVSSPSR